MDIFKFGGGSLQSPDAVKRIPHLIQEKVSKPLVLVVSALANVTRKLETVFQHYLYGQDHSAALDKVYQFHLTFAQELLDTTFGLVQAELKDWQQQISDELTIPCPPNEAAQHYSNLIAWGELLSSRIIYHYLLEASVPCVWLDARDYIKTKIGFMNATLDEEHTYGLVQHHFTPLLAAHQIILTQGFIGRNLAGHTTTLGKEGSDFTGAILAAALQADSLTIWKDVPGIMNGDPKLSDEMVQFDKLPYETMAHMSFYGAQVVHPKTIAPLAQRNIPLYIRSFKDEHAHGTEISNCAKTAVDQPIYVLKQAQLFVKLRVGPFVFFEERALTIVFEFLSQLALQANFIERTPYTLSLCLDDDGIKTAHWVRLIQPVFQLTQYPHAALLTVLGTGDPFQGQAANIVSHMLEGKQILTKQYTEKVCQVVFL